MNHFLFPNKPTLSLAKLLAFGLMAGGSASTLLYASNPSELKLNVLKNITGKVVDQHGKPLQGVTVTVKGSTTATSTDADGTFRLNLPPGKVTLVLKHMGYKSKEYVVSNQELQTIRLEANSNDLEEVVTVGYTTQKKAHLTGSVVDIKAEEIEDLPTTNIGAALAGRLLGVGVSGGLGRPGSKANITIRQPISFGKDVGSTDPLYVIDGVVQLNGQNQPDATLFNNLDPSEIESISILKDGAAAVYGMRGANGVVLVTTKKGKVGTPRINYSGSYAINDEAYRTKMMNAYQFGMYYNTMNGPNGENILPANSNYVNRIFSADELEHFKGNSYSWLDDAWKSSYLTRHSLNVSGGTESATYFANVAYNKQNGNLGTLDYDRWNFRAGSDVKVASNFKVGMQVSGNMGNSEKTFNKIGGESEENDYKNLLMASPYIPSYVNGLPVRLPGTSGDLSAYHFFELQRLGNLSTTDSRQFTVNINGEYQAPWLDGLKLRLSYNKNLMSGRGTQIGTKYQTYEFSRLGDNQHIYDGATNPKPLTFSNGNRVYFSNSNGNNSQLNFTALYDKSWKLHHVSALVSVEKGESNSSQEDIWKDDPISQTNGQFNTAFGPIDGRTAAHESGSLSYIGRVNYRYGEKYLAEVLFRSDASTKFAPENYWGKFYNLSLGWVISEEDFFKVSGIDYLKLRFSHGKLGHDTFTPWAWRQRYTFQDGKGAVFGGNNNGTTGMKMEKSPNPDATWSNEYKNNVGIDARFLDNRLAANIDAYYNKGSDILIERTGNIAITVGGSIAGENFGKANTYGYELGLSWQDKINDFNYGISTRFSWSDMKVIQMDFNDVDLMFPWKPQPNASSDNGMWGYDYLGMFRSQQEIDNYVSQYNIKEVFGTLAKDLKPGMLYYRDVRGAAQADGTFEDPDGIINDNDQVQLAKRKDNHYGFGITLKAGYKGFTAEAVLAGSFGGYAEISDRNKLNNDLSRAYTNLPVIWGDIYDPELNPTGTMPNPNWDKIYNVSSDFWTVPAFRMRMTSFNIGYTLPQKFTQYLKISNAKAFLSAINPMSLYNPYSYKDGNGAAWDSYPNLRTYSFGINVTL